MPDREKVIKALEHCATGTNSCDKCPMKSECRGLTNKAMVAAIDLLRRDEIQLKCKDEIIKAADKMLKKPVYCPNCGALVEVGK